MAITNTREVQFESDIEHYLINKGGYTKGNQSTYDKDLAMDVEKLASFLEDTQSKEWRKYLRIYGDDAIYQLGKRVNDMIDQYGLLHVLRSEVTDRGCRFKLIAFKPESTLNTETMRMYEANRIEVIRQFSYEKERNYTLDMVLSINGIPMVALELKNQLTGQSVDDAKTQYIRNRNPREKCFQFNKRFLVYFAVDLYEAWMTTKLAKEKTYFLPFNQGSNGAGNVGGKGNPSNSDGYATSYLWENILKKDSLLAILQRFLHLDVDEKTKKQSLIFPRYHQWDLVTKLSADVKANGAGKNYLAQHSTGSGKSYSITWLAYRLSTLHDELNQSVFNTVIIVTDRRVLDQQLQKDIMSFDHTPGVVETIDEKKSSKDLRDAINDGRRIIITTLQKFPVIYKEVENTQGKKFAVIVDEAHSSQTGSSAQKLKVALGDKTEALRQFAEIEELEEEELIDEEDFIVQEMLAHGKHSNMSFFAFTATPKPQTIEMFETPRTDGGYRPFHIYSMRQAIEEGFILDVLENYMTYETSYQIAKATEDNPEIPVTQGVKAIRRFQSMHPFNLRQKTIVMVEQFREITAKKINGQAKAMLVTSSRLHAVRYYYEFKDYIKEQGYDNLDVLVAFTGVVNDAEREYSEASINKTKDGRPISERQLPNEFDTDNFNMLIVAEKYQTGFNQPKLHTMFIDKKLKGVKAVQTLSRLNRTTSGKTDTFILDFANKAEDIQEAFKPYFDATELSEPIDVNMVYDMQQRIRAKYLYNDSDIDKFIKIYYKEGRQTNTDLGRMTSLFKPILERYQDLGEEEQYQFRVGLRKFIKWYGYITQITRIFDGELHKEFIFAKYLEKFIPKVDRENVDLDGIIQLEYYNLKESFKGDISIKENDGAYELTQVKGNTDPMKPEELSDTLDSIINGINKEYPGVVSEENRVILEDLVSVINEENKQLERSAKTNDFKMFLDTFQPIFDDKTIEQYDKTIETHDKKMKAYEKIFQDPELYHAVRIVLAKEAYKKYRSVVL
ncbi:type I restriction endonuclease subunit R [Fundicoccus culcitae]|uniref:DEAD/DEAH box helicase family protein n=1 Tax=Fundicoccus culcitae TaxID=2969821 RepID=A0ABY5P3N3_9LACT|nr:DEAD/DEAH box helicase family protein [Fundicoccus culcitae]UUX33274.1 DEAD/DEAH box helicase family protein [Fundicoccus culcitae]